MATGTRPDFALVQLSAAGVAAAGQGAITITNARKQFTFKPGEQQEVERSYEWNKLLRPKRIKGQPIFEEASASSAAAATPAATTPAAATPAAATPAKPAPDAAAATASAKPAGNVALTAEQIEAQRANAVRERIAKEVADEADAEAVAAEKKTASAQGGK